MRRSPPQQTEGPQRCAQPPFIVTRRWSRALSPPGAQGDAVHHALHLLLIPQDVGLHGADLVLLVADQLLQLGQLRPQWLHGTVRDAGRDKTAVSTWPRLARASSSRQWKAATVSCSPHPEKKRKYFLKPLNYGCREGPRDGREGSSEARRRWAPPPGWPTRPPPSYAGTPTSGGGPPAEGHRCRGPSKPLARDVAGGLPGPG